MQLQKKLQELNADIGLIHYIMEIGLFETWSRCNRGDWRLWMYANLSQTIDNKLLYTVKGKYIEQVRQLMIDERTEKWLDAMIDYTDEKTLAKALEQAKKAYAEIAEKKGDSLTSLVKKTAYIPFIIEDIKQLCKLIPSIVYQYELATIEDTVAPDVALERVIELNNYLALLCISSFQTPQLN